MGKYIIRRVVGLIPQLLIMLALVVVLVDLAPGDVIDTIVGDAGQLDPETRANLERSLGIDRPLPVRYIDYVSGVVQGDLGDSILRRRPVVDMIAERVSVTVELAGFAVVVSILLGVTAGVGSALTRGRVADYVIRFFGVFALGVPNFVFATLLVLLPALWWGWRPPLYSGWDDGVVAHLSSMVLPVLSVALSFTAVIMRMTRSSFIEVMQQDYIRTARAKGLQARNVWLRHGLKNALLPTVTLVGIQAASLISGSVIVEQVFSLPGLGGVLFSALSGRDYPVIQGMIVVVGVVVVTVNLLVDIVYTWLDPRVRFG